MFVLGSNITIGTYKQVKPHEVKVTKSMFEYVDKAVIKLPITARVLRAGEVITLSAESAKQFNEGDKVAVELGYNGFLKSEFVGFVSRVNFTSPLELECEGYSYQLRQKIYTHTFSQASLLSILKYLVSGTDIILEEKRIPAFTIEKLVLQQSTGTEALEQIKKISDNTIRIFFTGKTLYAGLQYLNPKADVKYRLGYNVIKDGNLKLREKKHQDVQINYIGEKNDGTTATAKAGKGQAKVVKVHDVTDQGALQQMATAKQSQMSYDGYEGKITAFGAPYCEPGYRAILDDQKYTERSGNYIIESVEVNYGMSGYRRIVGIGAKL